jgi:hypothetical protein
LISLTKLLGTEVKKKKMMSNTHVLIFIANTLITMEQVWKDYQEKNKDRFLKEMMELLRIPSVSAKSEHKEDMRRCADAVRQSILDAGADRAEVMETAGRKNY